MKRLQLFSSNKYFSLSSKSSDEGNSRGRSPARTRPRRYQESRKELELRPKLHLLNLPSKVLSQIIGQLDVNTLLSLCQVNSELYELISNEFLYRRIILDNKLSLLKFNALIHSEFRTSSALAEQHCCKRTSQNVRFLVRSIEFRNPQCQDSLLKYSKYYHSSANGQEFLAGSYGFDNDLTPTISNSKSRTSESSTGSSRRHSDKLEHAVSERYRNLYKLECQFSQYTYIELMLDIIDYLPNLSQIVLDNVQPGFKVPLWYSVLNDGSKDFFKKIISGQQSMNYKDLRTFEISADFASKYEDRSHLLPRVKHLEIRAALDKRTKRQVHLKSNLFCCFGIIDELILQNVIIDTESLEAPLEFVPFHLRLEPSGVYDLHSTVRSLTLKSCEIIPGNGILTRFYDYFKCVRELRLLEVISKFDMLLCNCFPSLTELTIDCSSPCFTNEKVVNDDYYYEKEALLDSSDQILESDQASIPETLLDQPIHYYVAAPPPTSPVVLALQLKYLTKTTVQSQSGARKAAQLTTSQNDFFKSSSVPEFHRFFHYNKKLWDRLPRKNININIVNIPFTNVFPMSPQLYCEKLLKPLDDDQQTLLPPRAPLLADDRDKEHYWDCALKECLLDSIQDSTAMASYCDLDVQDLINDMDLGVLNNLENFKMFQDIPNLNAWFFLKSLSEFKSVRIHMLKQWLFCTPRTRFDWEILLKPVLNVNVPVEVRDRDGVVLYSYGSKKLPKRRAST
ncbi:hypothetical protein HG537_0E02460 [Torulaspora globosa]|uniref:F-box domain-containing protein n=1 Tax=Torulaspora globosa TaxID=48254 RepID=A0A7H9HU77_9SACH|nr:hypothetical protein HG537_0E02460 [Torulaspora sp. CBS 2947]